jgi:hypothetical protein
MLFYNCSDCVNFVCCNLCQAGVQIIRNNTIAKGYAMHDAILLFVLQFKDFDCDYPFGILKLFV